MLLEFGLLLAFMDFLLSGQVDCVRRYWLYSKVALDSCRYQLNSGVGILLLHGTNGAMVPRQVGQARSEREEGARSLFILTPLHNAGPCGCSCCCPLACLSCWCCPPSSESGPHRFSCCGRRWSTIRRRRCSSRSLLSELALFQRCAHPARSAVLCWLHVGTRRTKCRHLARSAGSCRADCARRSPH